MSYPRGAHTLASVCNCITCCSCMMWHCIVIRCCVQMQPCTYTSTIATFKSFSPVLFVSTNILMILPMINLLPYSSVAKQLPYSRFSYRVPMHSTIIYIFRNTQCPYISAIMGVCFQWSVKGIHRWELYHLVLLRLNDRSTMHVVINNYCCVYLHPSSTNIQNKIFTFKCHQPRRNLLSFFEPHLKCPLYNTDVHVLSAEF